MLGFVLLIVGVVVLVAWLVGRTQPDAQSSSSRAAGQDALEILRVRFARGEITREEYLATRQTLEEER
jgi:putative membrane protein